MLKDLAKYISKGHPSALTTDIIEEVEFFDTGIPTLNYVLSGRPKTGGFPLSGKGVIFYGPEGAGKTTLVGHLIASAQKQDVDVIFMDTERSITKTRLRQFGIDINKILYITPETIEEVFDIIEDVYNVKLSNNDQTKTFLVWDSVAATPSGDEISRKADDKEFASQAGPLTRNLRRIRSKIKRMNMGILFINQARANMSRYGDEIQMPGGYALRHMCDTMCRVSLVKPDERGQGVKIATPRKNRLFRPLQSTELRLDYTSGFKKEDMIASFCDLLVQMDFLRTSGAWCYLNSDVISQMATDANLTENEAIKNVKKFYKKDFTERLINDPEYYNSTLITIEDYIGKHFNSIISLTADEEIKKELGEEVFKKKLEGIDCEEDGAN